MADTYTVVTQYPTLEFLGGTQTQDVMAVGYRTAAHQVYFEVRIPRSVYNAQQVKDYGIAFSATVESVFINANVIGAEWTQTPTPAGELADNIVATVQSDSGNSTAQYVIPFSQLAPAFFTQPLENLIATLNDAEAA